MTRVDSCPECGGKTRMGSADIITGDEEYECLNCHHIYYSNYFDHCKGCGVNHVAEWLHWAGKHGFCSTKCYTDYMGMNRLW